MQFLKALWASNNLLLRILRIALAVAFAVAILLVAFEDKLIYFPEKYPAGDWRVAETSGRSTTGVAEGSIVPRIEDCFFETDDHVRIHGWYCTPVRRRGDGFESVLATTVLLWFHGNAGNITYRYDMIRFLIGIPVDIFIIDYRGYGRSTGTPTEKGLYLDAEAAWNYLINERSKTPEKIIIFGKSLGGVPGVDLASTVRAGGLIVQSSFSSAKDMAAAVLPFFPAFLLHSKMNSIDKIGKVTCPKLFIHSRTDEVVPFRLGYRLFEAAGQPKEFLEVTGSHNTTYLSGGRPYLEALKRFVEQCSIGPK
jgi:pimeloyl-ACP methyl ester carboxylesterase